MLLKDKINEHEHFLVSVNSECSCSLNKNSSRSMKDVSWNLLLNIWSGGKEVSFHRDHTHSPWLTNHIRDTSPGKHLKNKYKSGVQGGERCHFVLVALERRTTVWSGITEPNITEQNEHKNSLETRTVLSCSWCSRKDLTVAELVWIKTGWISFNLCKCLPESI